MVYIILIWLGLAFGSFVNALVWRLRKKRDWVKERSECTHCHHELHTSDLIPVFSWLWLRGKCRYCHKKIEDTPIPEIIVPLSFCLSYAVWPYGFSFAGWVVFALWLITLIIFTALALYDLRWMILPDGLNLLAAGLALAVFVWRLGMEGFSGAALINGLLGIVAVAGIFYGLFQLSKGRWIGGGDVKLGVALGLLAGSFQLGLLTVFLASFFGTCVATILLILGKKKLASKLPFGPYLLAASFAVFLWGQPLINWYKTTILLV